MNHLLFLGLVASLACFIIWNLVIDKLGNVTSTNYVYLNPIFTLISAMIFLGEKMTPVAALGSASVSGIPPSLPFGRAVKALIFSDMLKTNRPIAAICFQERTYTQIVGCPAEDGTKLLW